MTNIITWNCLHPGDRYQSIAKNVERMNNVIDKVYEMAKTSIICLQEYPLSLLAQLEEKLGTDYMIVKELYGAFNNTSYLIVIFNKKHKLISTSYENITPTDWKALSVILDINGKQLQIINTHIKGGSYGYNNRSDIFTIIFNMISLDKVVICGDLNTNFSKSCDQDALKLLTDLKIDDDENKITEVSSGRKLDHFISNINGLYTNIYNIDKLSDHQALQATFIL